MSDIICVTNRALCSEDIIARIEKLAKNRPAAIILREKDMGEEEYAELAAKVIRICASYGTQCILHTFVTAAKSLSHPAIHLPLPLLRAMPAKERASFRILGASCHSTEDAAQAQSLGCTYITVGHIFDTDCKAGIPGRGIDFLAAVCRAVCIPVYAIGGITSDSISAVRAAGAAGGCVMSGAMKCEDAAEYLESFQRR